MLRRAQAISPSHHQNLLRFTNAFISYTCYFATKLSYFYIFTNKLQEKFTNQQQLSTNIVPNPYRAISIFVFTPFIFSLFTRASNCLTLVRRTAT